MARKVSFRPHAEADLIALYEYIADRAGAVVAGRSIDRIESACLTLRDFPERGMRRDDFFPGLRTIGFERRATIAFRILKARVEIVTVAYGGRDWESDLSDRN